MQEMWSSLLSHKREEVLSLWVPLTRHAIL